MRNMRRVRIGERYVGDGCPAFIVAEVSANHGQNFNRAARLIREAKRCGADAVKFQTYTPDTLTINVRNRHFRIKHHKWGGLMLYELYQQAYTPWDWFPRLKHVAADEGIMFFSTAYDRTAVDFLEDLKVPLHKIASFELVDIPLIEYMAKTGKPIILSTGMASRQEIQEAVAAARGAGAKDVILLKCVSSYPASPNQMHLRTIPHMRRLYRCPVGISDHTLGTVVSVAAAALGAHVIEKHLTLSRSIKTADSFFSIEPAELTALVEGVRIVERATGGVHYGPAGAEKDISRYRRSLFAVKDIAKGESFTEENIRSIRPAAGLAPRFLKRIIGKRTRRRIKRGTPLQWELIR